MREIDKKILRFLLSASVYSEEAIKKNFGIDEIELKIVFENLEKNGFLESYEKYLEREKLNEIECCKSKKESHCKSCKSSCSLLNDCCSSNPFSQIEDYKNIKILTEKALNHIF